MITKDSSCFRAVILSLLLSAGPVGQAQSLIVPQQLDALLERAQEFRTSLAAGNLIKAQEYVIPEARNRVLAGQGQLFRAPRVVGIDLSEDPFRVTVRVRVRAVSAIGSTAGEFVVKDDWVWVGDEWFFDTRGFRRVWESDNLPGGLNTDALKRQLELDFELLQDHVDLGTLIRGEHRRISVPIRYRGAVAARIDTTLPSKLLTLDAVSARLIDSDTSDIALLVSSEDWDGPFNIPLPLEIHSQGVSIRRTVRVEGSVFVPLALERTSEGLSDPAEYRFIIVNNTEESIQVAYVSVDGKMDILGHSDEIPPGGRGFIHLRRDADRAVADRLTIVLKKPLFNKRDYVFRLRLEAVP